MNILRMGVVMGLFSGRPASAYASTPAPPGYVWNFVTENGSRVTENGSLVVELKVIGS